MTETHTLPRAHSKVDDLVLLTKTDLLPHLPEVRVEAIEDALSRVMPSPRMIPFSARTGEGVDAWLEWLEARRPSSRFASPTSAHA